MMKLRIFGKIVRTTLTYVITLLILSNSSFAQDTKKDEGYIVTVKSDTIYGKVQIHIRKGQLQSASVKNDGGKETFKVFQVLGLKTNNGNIYHTKKLLDKYQFAKLEHPGYASYYLYSSEEVSSDKFTEQVLIKPDGEYLTFSSLAFRKRVAEFLGDCESVQLKIENGEYKRKDLNKILDEYDACIISQTDLRARAMSQAPVLTQEGQQKVKNFAAFVEKIGKMEPYNGNEELMEMLNDVQSKLADQASVPGYLKGAIIEQLAENEALISEFESLVK